MLSLSHCLQCGRRLRDVIFCPRCKQGLCGCACLDEHIAHHPVPTAPHVGPEEPRLRIRLSPKVWRASPIEYPVARRTSPFRSGKPGGR